MEKVFGNNSILICFPLTLEPTGIYTYSSSRVWVHIYLSVFPPFPKIKYLKKGKIKTRWSWSSVFLFFIFVITLFFVSICFLSCFPTLFNCFFSFFLFFRNDGCLFLFFFGWLLLFLFLFVEFGLLLLLFFLNFYN